MKNLNIKKILSSILLFSLSSTLIAAPTLEKAWETAADFKLPESVVYDTKNNILYVSNANGDPFTKDSNGFVSKVSLDGKIIEQEWVAGMNSPKGMAISEEKLFVSDIDQLVEIEIASGKITNRYDAVGAAFLNDVAVDSKGNVYVSDTFTDTIYRLNKFGQLTTWLYSPALQAPNGLTVEGDQLIVGSWGLPTDGFGADVVGHLKTVSLVSKEINSLGNAKPVGNLDGIEADGHGAYYATDWVAGKLFRIKRDGSFDVLFELSQGSADLGVFPEQKLIVIPMMVDGKLLAFDIK